MSDFVEQPIKALMNENNPVSRIERVEELTGAVPSSTVNSLDEVANDIGIFGGGSNELILTPEGVEDVLPTSPDFTGTFVSGDGYEFNAELYNIGGVNAGVLQWGAKQTDGKISAGAGAVVLDEDGFKLTGNSNTDVNSVSWYSGSNLISFLRSYNQGFFTQTSLTNEPISGIDSYIDITSQGGNAATDDAVLSLNVKKSGASTTQTLSLKTSNSLVELANLGLNVNTNGGDLDTTIEGDTATKLLVVDAGLDAVQIGTTTAGVIMDARSSRIVFNENGADRDVRIEGDTATNLLLVDAGLDAVQIGDTTAGVIADFRTGSIVLNEDGADRDTRIEGDTATNLLVIDAGLDAVQIGTTTAADIMDACSASVVFNENSRDMDFRVESNGVANMLFIDGGADTIALNNVDMTPSTNTFTPTIDGTTTPGAGTYTTQAGVYFKIGKMVNFTINLTWTNHTGTGDILVNGLPFASANNGINAVPAVFFNNLTLTLAANKVQALVTINAQTIAIRQISNGAIANIPIDTAGTLNLSGWYLAA